MSRLATDGSSVGHLSGAAPATAIGSSAPLSMMQFDWHIQPQRITILQNADEKPVKLGVGAYGVVRTLQAIS